MLFMGASFVHIFFVVILVATPSVAHDVFRFANHFANHMVLQRTPQRARIWGYRVVSRQEPVLLTLTTYPNNLDILETITLTAEYDSASLWSVLLPAKPSGGPYAVHAMSMVHGRFVEIQISDIMFGDVWLCGGQSNMEFVVGSAFKGEDEIKLADKYPNIRLFTTTRYESTEPQKEIAKENILQQWSVASSSSVNGGAWSYFSAVCWMFGRRLYDQYKIPIGLISSNYGGTPVEAWSSPDALQKCNLTNEREDGPWQKSVLWNAMIYPFVNTTIYGAIWYQGENNWNKHLTKYGCMFPAMIADWREKWFSGLSEKRLFPFGFVQLSTLGIPMKYQPGRAAAFPELRWLQTAGYGVAPNPKMLNTFMAVSLDLPDNTSPYGAIHPRDKSTVADRLLLGARNIAYGEKNVSFSGPNPTFWQSQGSDRDIKVSIHFASDQALKVLVPTGFQVLLQYASSTEWVDVKICNCKNDDDMICVCASVVATSFNIIAVRYNWQQQPCKYKECAIYGGDLPAAPFIMDFKHRIV